MNIIPLGTSCSAAYAVYMPYSFSDYPGQRKKDFEDQLAPYQKRRYLIICTAHPDQRKCMLELGFEVIGWYPGYKGAGDLAIMAFGNRRDGKILDFGDVPFQP